jgi:hypothetical protein
MLGLDLFFAFIVALLVGPGVFNFITTTISEFVQPILDLLFPMPVEMMMDMMMAA